MGWYDGLNVNGSNFRQMAAQFASVQLPLLSKKLTLVSGSFDGLAYADIKNKRIVVQDSFLSGTNKFYEGHSWQKRLELFDAIVVHETGHFMYSPETLVGFKKGETFTTNIATIANLIEDLFIEDAIGSIRPVFSPLLHALNVVIINDDSIEESKSDTTGEKPATLEEAEAYVNYMISYKRRDLVFLHRSDFEREIFNLVQTVFGMNELQDRIDLIYEIYYKIFEEEVQQQDEQQNSVGSGEDGEGEGGDFSGMVGDATSSPSEGTVFVNTKGVKTFREISTPNREIPAFDTVDVTQHEHSFLEVLKPISGRKGFKMSRVDFSELVKVERSRGSVRSVQGQAAHSGRRLSHLHRALDDGKIFSTAYLEGQRAGRGSPEIVFLIDLSGSMNGTIRTSGASGSKAEFALSCVVELNRALRQTRVKYSIVGHTTVHKGSMYSSQYGLQIVEFKNVKEIVNDATMIERVRSTYMNCQFSGNADGAALLYANGLFSAGQHDKVLFIISDGLPAEDMFDQYEKHGVVGANSSNIVDNVSTVAKHIRRKGVKLFSAAIDNAAIAPCNRIYGEANNVVVNDVPALVNMVIKSLG